MRRIGESMTAAETTFPANHWSFGEPISCATRYIKEKLKRGHGKEKVIEEGATTMELRSADTEAGGEEVGSGKLAGG